MARPLPSIPDPFDRLSGAVRPAVIGVPAAVLLGFGLVIAAGVMIPIFATNQGAVAGGQQVRFATGSGVVSIPLRELGSLLWSLALPAVLCLAYTLLGFLGVDAVRAAVTLRDGRSGVPGRADLPSRPAMWRSLVSRADAFRRTYALFAVGLVPQALVTLLSVGVYLTYLLTPESCDGITFTPAGHMVIYDPSLPAAVTLTHGAGAVATLVTGVVWISALERGPGASRWTAAAVVTPLVGWLLYHSDLATYLPF